MTDPAKKKRKWDVAAPGSENQPPGDPTLAASLAAKKINLMLATTGVANIQAFEREVDVNSCRPETRYYLCRGTTHDEIGEKTGATIRVRGKYKPPGDTSLERPLHLLISATTQQSLDAAISRIQEIIKNDQAKQTAINQGVQFIHKVYVGMEGTDALFDVLAKIRGPNNSYIDHIQNTSKATVILKGMSSGHLESGLEGLRESTDPLHLYINAKNKQSADTAKNLCENLCSTIRQEYYAWQQQKQQSYQQYYNYPNAAQLQYYQQYNTAYGYGTYSQQQAYAQSQQVYAQPQQGYGQVQGYSYGYDPSAVATSASEDQTTSNGTSYDSTTSTTPASSSSPNSSDQASSNSPSATQGSQARNVQDKKSEFENGANTSGRKLPTDDEFSFYSEIAQISQNKSKTASPGPQGTKVPYSQLRNFEKSKNEEQPKLVDYADEEEKKNNTSTGRPFWAAPSALDDAEANPLKQREKAGAKLDSLQEDVYNELGLN